MREHSVPLYGLESGDPLKDFDFVGFTLQYELSYSNIFTMLSLSDIPFLSAAPGCAQRLCRTGSFGKRVCRGGLRPNWFT